MKSFNFKRKRKLWYGQFCAFSMPATRNFFQNENFSFRRTILFHWKNIVRCQSYRILKSRKYIQLFCGDWHEFDIMLEAFESMCQSYSAGPTIILRMRTLNLIAIPRKSTPKSIFSYMLQFLRWRLQTWKFCLGTKTKLVKILIYVSEVKISNYENWQWSKN